MDIHTLSSKIKKSLSQAEMDFLIETVKDDHLALLNNLVPAPNENIKDPLNNLITEFKTESDYFIYSTSFFLIELMKDHNADTIISENMIPEHTSYTVLVKHLVTFPVTEIKDILLRLLSTSENGIYDSIVSDFICSLQPHLSDSDFNFLLEDEPLSNYY